MPVWFSVQATPAKAFSVFPNLLCKQGAAGSSPATSTNYIFFQRNSVDVFSAYHLLHRQGVAGSNRLTSIDLILAAITHYAALASALFWCNLGTFGTIVSFRQAGIDYISALF